MTAGSVLASGMQLARQRIDNFQCVSAYRVGWCCSTQHAKGGNIANKSSNLLAGGEMSLCVPM